MAGAVAIAMVLGAGGASSAAALDEPRGAAEIDRLLASIGERDLRLDLLAWRAASLPPSREAARLRIFGEMATLLGEFLGASGPDDRPARLARAESLLALAASPREADPIRWEIALQRGIAAAELAERWRSRSRHHPSHADRAAEESRIRGWLRESAETLEQGVENRERARRELLSQMRRASGAEADLLAERQLLLASDSERGRFLAAWAWLGLVLLDRDRDAAARAERLLASLLDAGEDPSAAEISIDRRAESSFCRAIVGMAVARSLTRSPSEGRAWLGLLESGAVPSEIAGTLPEWSLELALQSAEWEVAERVVSSSSTGRVPQRALERAAAAAIDRAPAEAGARRLAEAAIALLLEEEATDAVIALAGAGDPRGRPEWCEADGFVARALAALQAVRGGHEPSAAVESLLEAAADPRARDAAAATLALEAAGRWLQVGEARRALEAIEIREWHGELPSRLAERLSWLRLAILDRLPADAAGGRWAEAAGQFLASFPLSEGAPLLRLRLEGSRLPAAEIAARVRASRGGAFEEAVAQEGAALLRSRLQDPLATERRDAANALRSILARGGAELPAADRLDLAESLLAIGDPASIEAAGRRLAEAWQEGLVGDQRDRWWRLEAERLLARGEIAAAAAAARRSEAFSAEGAWGRRLAAAWRAAPERIDLADAMVGAISLEEREIDLLQAAAAAAEARWRAEPSDGRGARWIDLATRAAELEPSNEAIAAIGRAAASTAAWPQALESSRELLSRLPADSDGWLDAKRLQLASLAEIDPGRAAAVLRQHQALRPEWRRGRHGEWLAALEQRLSGDSPSGDGR